MIAPRVERCVGIRNGKVCGYTVIVPVGSSMPVQKKCPICGGKKWRVTYPPDAPPPRRAA